jgi:hypothetical protein
MIPSLASLLDGNPFRVLALPLEADARSVRDRVDELEMAARLNGDTSFDRTSLLQAAAALKDPDERVVAELFSPWKGTHYFGAVAEPHDTALDWANWITANPTGITPQHARDAARAWGALLEDQSSATAYEARARALGVSSSRAQLVPIVAEGGLARVVRRCLDSAPDSSLAILEALERLASDVGGPLQLEALRPALERLAQDDRPLSMGDVERCGKGLEYLDDDSQAFTELEEALTTAVHRDAVRAFNAGNFTQALNLITVALECMISEPVRRKFEQDEAMVLHSLAWRNANAAVERKDINGAIAELEEALRTAPDNDARVQTITALSQLHDVKKRTTGVEGFARRVWSAIGGFVVLVVVVAVIGSISSAVCNSEDEPQSSATGQPPGSSSSSSGGADAGGSSGSTSYLAKIDGAVGGYVDALDAPGLAANDYDTAERSSQFPLAATNAANAAQTLLSTSRSLRASTGDSSCKLAVERYATTAAEYWSLLARGARMSDVDDWNRAVDLQPQLNVRFDSMDRECWGG